MATSTVLATAPLDGDEWDEAVRSATAFLPPAAKQIPPAANSTLRRRISTLSAWFTWLEDEEINVGNPAARVRRPRRHARPQPWLDRNELTDLLAATEDEAGYAYALIFGWLLRGVRGGLVAGGLFVLPGFVAIMVLSVLYAGFGDVAAVEAIFYGIKPAVMAVVAAGVFRIGSRALKNRTMIGIAVAAFVGILFLDIPFPFIIAAAAVHSPPRGRPQMRDVGHRAPRITAGEEERLLGRGGSRHVLRAAPVSRAPAHGSLWRTWRPAFCAAAWLGRSPRGRGLYAGTRHDHASRGSGCCSVSRRGGCDKTHSASRPVCHRASGRVWCWSPATAPSGMPGA